MTRTTITLPEDVLDSLRRLAMDEKKSMATVVREALEERLARHHPKPRSLGIGASGFTDTARTLAAEGRTLEPPAWR